MRLKHIWIFTLILLGCEKIDLKWKLDKFPTLVSLDATKITSVNAESGGNISPDGGAPITQRGVCWSVDENPTTTNNKTSDGSGTGNYVSILDNLQPDTKYYVRAYATNKVGTSYGNQVSFTTLPELVSTNNCNSLGGFFTKVEQGTPDGSQSWYIDAGYINNGLKVTSCFGGYVEFSLYLSSITKMRFWAKGSSPKVIVDGTLINTTMIQGASNTWKKLETQSIASGSHYIRIDFPRSPVYRTLYVDEIEFYAY